MSIHVVVEELFTSTTLNLTKWRPSGSAYATAVGGTTSVTPWGVQDAGASQDQADGSADDAAAVRKRIARIAARARKRESGDDDDDEDASDGSYGYTEETNSDEDAQFEELFEKHAGRDTTRSCLRNMQEETCRKRCNEFVPAVVKKIRMPTLPR